MGRYNTREKIRESSPATNPVFSRGCEEFNNITVIKFLKTGEISIGSCEGALWTNI